MKKNSAQSYITKHKKYIDYRLNHISDYVTSLDDNNNSPFIQDIVNYLISAEPHNKLIAKIPGIISESIAELKSIADHWDIMTDGDVLGYIYQMLESKTSKKNKGQYFTPGDIVNHISRTSLSHCEISPDVTMLDLACGSGQFLISMYRLLRKKYLEASKDPDEASKLIIENNLYGFDIDPLAVKIAKYNLAKISGCPLSSINIYNLNFLYHDELNLCGNRIPDLKFDIIIGNPPWGSTIAPSEKKYFRKKYCSPSSGLNTFSLFIERAFDLVSERGTIAFLIPEAYLNIKAHRSNRKFVLSNSLISELSIWGERFKGVFAPSISIILQREERSDLIERNIVNIIQGKSSKERTATLVPQASFHRTPENIFNINYSRKSANIITSIEDQNCFYLKNQSKFYLGIVTGNNTEYIHDSGSEEHPDPIILGKDISQYRINFSNHYFKFNPGQLQQVAPQQLYNTRNKILYKFIGKRLTFALDNEGYYSLNNVNGLIPDTSKLNMESMLSVLNSDLMQYYYENNFFTVKVLRGNLERLPLKNISRDNQKRLKKLTQLVMNSSGHSAEKHRDNIEDIIFHEYSIRDRDAYMISGR